MNAQAKDDFVISTLKKRYFDIIRREDIPNTAKITEEADRIEAAIRELQGGNK